MIGRRFSRLLVVATVDGRSDLFICKCKCGKIVKVLEKKIANRSVFACKECTKTIKKSQDETLSNLIKRYKEEYNCWRSLRKSGRMCKKWEKSFIDFLEDVGPKPTGSHRIDRKNRKHKHKPHNSFWTGGNYKASKNTVMVEYSGCVYRFSWWLSKMGIGENYGYHWHYANRTNRDDPVDGDALHAAWTRKQMLSQRRQNRPD